MLQKAGIDLIPSNDFSYYDTTLDLTLTLGAIPSRYNSLKEDKLRLYFAMAHGEQNEQKDVIAMEISLHRSGICEGSGILTLRYESGG